MITPNPREPKLGERVRFQGGIYDVVKVYPKEMKADLKLLHSDYIEKDVPWGTFTFAEDKP